MSRIFISHSSANNAAALAIAKWLADAGWAEYFLDITPSRGLAPGERWQEALKSAADRCEAVLFLISPAWQASRWCLAEFLLAKQIGKTIFGVLVEATPLDALPKEMTAEWQLCDLVTGSARQSFRVSQEPIVPDTEVSFAEDGLVRLRIGLQRAGLDPASFAWPPPSDPNRPPYRGLKALEPEDAAIFFGRESAIVRGLDALRGSRERGVERLFVILGASGAGKSSYLRAGLWPRLVRDDTRFLPLPVVRPERAVIAGATGLAASLETAFRERKAARSRAAINQALQKPGGLDRLLSELQGLAASRIDPDAPPPTVVISIDQGEELFGAEGGAEAERFLDLLAQTLSPPGGEGAEALAARQRALAIVGIRSDSYERLQTEPRLAQVAPYLFSLPPIARAEFKTIVEGPARRHSEAGHKLTVDPALTERLVDETEGADALPLLAFTLERLFVEHGGDGKLLLEDYEALGGVRGSIEAAIDAAFTEPGRAPIVPADKGAREHLLRAGFIPWLARVDPDTEERKRRVARWEEIPPEAQPLLDRLIEQRLLVRDRRRLAGREDVVVVEVAHEALLRQWPTLTAWLDEDAQSLKILDAVQRAAGEWAKNRVDESAGDAWLVHTGERLATAEGLRQRPDFDRLLGSDGQAYLDACRARDERLRKEKEERAEAERIAKERELEQAKALAEEQRRRADEQAAARIRQRRFSLGLVALLVVAAGTAFYGWYQQGLAEAKRLEAESQERLALSRQLTSLASNEMGQRGLQRALLFGTSAYRAAPINEARQILQRALAAQPQLRTFLSGHREPLYAVAFSPDGKTLASASDDDTVILWDVASRKPLGEPLTGHQKVVWSVAFSPDGKMLASASWDKTVILWDTASRKPLGEPLKGHQKAVLSVAFSPDGKTLASASEDKTVILWDVASREPSHQPLARHENVVRSVAFSPDGKTLASASSDKTVILWDLANREPLGEPLKGHVDFVESVAFSPDGKTLASASGDKTVNLWDVASRELLGEPLKGHQKEVLSVAFSPDGKTLASAGDGLSVILWDVASRKPLGEPLKGAGGRVAFSPDGRTLASLSADNSVSLWDVTSRNSFGESLEGQAQVSSVAFSPDGKMLASASLDRTVVLWDVASRRPLGEPLKGHQLPVLSVSFSPDGKTLASAGRDYTVILWDLASRKPLGEPLKGHEYFVESVTFSPDGKILASASQTTVILWDVASRKPLGQPIEGHRSVAFSPDGKMLASASGGTTVILWDVASRTPLGEPLNNSWQVSSVAFSPDGRTLASGQVLWDVASRKPLRTLYNGGGGHVAFSPDGKTLATTTSGFWDVTKRKPLGTPLDGHRVRVDGVAFSPDGKTLATASEDDGVILWDVEVASWLRKACTIANRNLTHKEWAQYVGEDVPYQAPCPDLPISMD